MANTNTHTISHPWLRVESSEVKRWAVWRGHCRSELGPIKGGQTERRQRLVCLSDVSSCVRAGCIYPSTHSSSCRREKSHWFLGNISDRFLTLIFLPSGDLSERRRLSSGGRRHLFTTHRWRSSERLMKPSGLDSHASFRFNSSPTI